jgi:hypothetical protein
MRSQTTDSGYRSWIQYSASGPILQVFKQWKATKLVVLKLNFESRTVAPSVSSGSLFASQIDFLRTEVKPFRFHKTERANNHIKQGDTLVFAYNPIGVTYNRLPAMLTNTIHIFSKGQGTCHRRTICLSEPECI